MWHLGEGWMRKTSKACADLAIKESMPMTCKVAGCTTTHVRGGNGYCNRHYLQIWSRGSIQPERKRHPICTIDGCDKATRSAYSPYCEMHYARLRRNGSPDRRVEAQAGYPRS